ncbi:hypothetical protein C8Q74DRAFT_1368502 [Fomes fomentarius]|nr:hypothetical protein C8Q74DRAFT_1368502 [Fomes fomentarius]
MYQSQDYPTPTLTAEQIALRDQLAEYNAAVLELSARINALSLPSRLPPEVLSKIFLVYANMIHEEDVEWDDPDPEGHVHSYYSWIYVSHVCRYWRDVALECAPLWAFIAFETYTFRISAYHRILKRAGACPLTVVYHLNGGCDCSRAKSSCSDDYGLDHIFELLPRIRHLIIIIGGDIFMDPLWKTLRCPAPCLETLQVGLRGEALGTYTEGLGDDADDDEHLVLPNKLFAQKAPRLRSVVIANMGYMWTNTLFKFSSLRHIEIKNRRTSSAVHDVEDMEMLLAMLSATPLLESLSVNNALAPVCSVESVVSLPHLRYIQLQDSPGTLASVLSHLHLPTFTSIHLHLVVDGVELLQEDISGLVEALSPLLEASPFHTVLYTVPAQLPGCDKHAYFCGWACKITDVDHLWDARSDIPSRLVLKAEGLLHLPKIFNQLDLSSVRALYIRGPTPSTDPWGPWFASAPNVVLLRLTGRSGYLAGTSVSEAMPHLRVIQFVRVTFPPPRRFSLDMECWCDRCECLDGIRGKRGIDVRNLAQGLLTRRQLGATEIDRIEFVDCPHMKMSHIRPLLRVGPLVFFNGILLYNFIQ